MNPIYAVFNCSLLAMGCVDNLGQYLEDYYRLLSSYYNINKRKVNPDKTRLVLFCKTNVHSLKDFSFKADTFDIKPRSHCKVLGVVVSQDLSFDRQTNLVVSKVNDRLSTLKSIGHYTTERTRQILADSMIVSVIVYAIPLFISSSDRNKTILNKLLVSTAKYVIGYYNH